MNYDVIIIGAGAAGLFCAITAAKQGARVCVLEKSSKAAKKIRISGGGRCNFTNLYTSAENYISDNPHFCKSALSRFTPYDFISYLAAKELSFTEKHQGQLFCDQKAEAVVEALLADCTDLGVELKLDADIKTIAQDSSGFTVDYSQTKVVGQHLVVATGGPSIPNMGASSFALSVAKQFGIKTTPFKPALVPLVLSEEDKFSGCEGVAFKAKVATGERSFNEDLLITHKGLSGPAILQISSYWSRGEILAINFVPELSREAIKQWFDLYGGKHLNAILKKHLPNRLAAFLSTKFPSVNLAEFNQKQRLLLIESLTQFSVIPLETEGMRVAEVSTGGVRTAEVSSKTFAAYKVPKLYFIGESLDVTGHLGGFNFQWAWASGFCAGKWIADNLDEI